MRYVLTTLICMFSSLLQKKKKFLRGLLSPALPFGFGGWFFLPTYSSSGASTAGKESFPSPLVEPGAARLLITKHSPSKLFASNYSVRPHFSGWKE